MKKWQILCNIILEVAFFLIGCVLAIIFIPRLMGFFWPFVASGILSILAAPLCSFLEKHIKLTKKWASALILIVVLLALVFCGYSIIALLAKEIFSLLSNATVYYNYWLELIENLANLINERVAVISPDIGKQLQIILNDLVTNLGSLVNDIAPRGVEILGSVASNVTNGLIGIIVMILSAYFFIAEKDKIAEELDKILPGRAIITVTNVKNRLVSALGGFMKAQFKIMFIIFVILLIGLMILRNPYALLFALLISFLDLLPILGTGTVLIPWAVISFLNGEIRQMIFLIILYIICLLARQMLQPKIIGDSLGLGTLPTLILIYVGYKFSGMKGMILALLIGVIFITLFRIGLFDKKIRRVNLLINQYLNYDEKEDEEIS